MSEAFYPALSPDPALRSPMAATQGEVLDKSAYRDLYELASEAGLPYFARLNGAGEVELYLVFESVDAFVEQTRDAVSVEFKTYQGKLLGVIWTLSDPLQPLGFPLTFDIRQAEQRGMALKMLEQPCTLLHYLAYEGGALTHIYTESLSFSAAEVERTRDMIRSLFEGKSEAIPQEAQVREEETLTVSALSLPDAVLLEDGLAYVFSYKRMVEAHGTEGAQHLLMNTVRQAVWVMRRHARSEVREAAFTVWVAERGELLELIVTPSLFELFAVVPMSEEEANPFSRFLLTLPTFVQTKEASALRAGAFPLLRYENGALYHLELDEQVQERLRALFVKAFPGQPVPYE
ncbi:hypothetical protein [Brevibacillus sp. SAFN-007a]|uniref:hypothetical protein n=1 Tax=Brevibacillus sp. SAFN-007a TaxID=3436862 RepID=UPI003F7E8305